MPFSAQWLRLRESADHAARDQQLLVEAAKLAGDNPVVLDLGCGTGSNARALSPHLPPETIWHLVDNDPELLRIAQSETPGASVGHLLDLNELDQLPFDQATLVTGSALLDLVSIDWFQKLAERACCHLYFALSYNGQMSFDPADQADEAIVKSFNAHQKSDKGFGVAMGPDATTQVREILVDAGYEVFSAPSDWALGPAQSALQAELIQGIAQAADQMNNPNAQGWGERRVLATSQSSCNIGHEDLLAIYRR